jgi:hypothetical protein
MMRDGFDFRGRVTHADEAGRALVKQARRDYCEENDHSIHRLLLSRNAAGQIVISKYGCSNCDVKVELSYPDDAPKDGHTDQV